MTALYLIKMYDYVCRLWSGIIEYTITQMPGEIIYIPDEDIYQAGSFAGSVPFHMKFADFVPAGLIMGGVKSGYWTGGCYGTA